MGKTAIVYTCGHANPHSSNERYDWLGDLIFDVQPDYVIDLGDGADMRSLSLYESGNPGQVVLQNYEKDIQSYHDSMERVRRKFKQRKRKQPYWIGFEGNHENRIKKAVARDPRLEGQTHGVSFSHLQTDKWFDEYHEYEHSAPSIADYDGVSYAHYFTAPNSPSAISGVHHAYTLLNHRNYSSTCGHSHRRGIYFKDGAYPSGLIGLVAGCFKGSEEDWAGQSNSAWWKGVVIKREIENGMYDPEFISMKRLEEEYGNA